MNRETVVFENRGLVPLEAIKTFGMNVKVVDNPVGYFGTGLKYAIAVCLREGLQFTIWRGKTKLDFELRDKTIRGKKFRVVHMNGEALGFTDELGKNWELWQAFRELYCNCHDEEEPSVQKVANAAGGRAGTTRVVVRGSRIAREYDNRSMVFIEDEQPIVEHKGVEAYHGECEYIYYRGVRAGEPDGTAATQRHSVRRNCASSIQGEGLHPRDAEPSHRPPHDCGGARRRNSILGVYF